MPFINVTREQGSAFAKRPLSGPVVMLNLLRFNAVADYAAAPELAPASPISGKEAYRKYMENVGPLLDSRGGSLRFSGEAEAFVIGPAEEHWDWALLVEHQSTEAFLAFAKDPAYLAVVGHRTAALADARLLPLVEGSF